MGNKNAKDKVSLEALLRLKRSEQPADDFWDSFEKDFHRRRLHALFEKEPLRERIWNPFLTAAMVGAPVLLLMVMAVLWNRPDDGTAIRGKVVAANAQPAGDFAGAADKTPAVSVAGRDSRPGMDGQRASSQFVVDAIHADSDRALNFHKVLYTPALHISGPAGASYVRDTFSSRSYDVTTADVRLGRNF